MKPKLALITFGDKVLLALLALFVLWAVSQAFSVPKEASPAFRREMEGLAATIQANMTRGGATAEADPRISDLEQVGRKLEVPAAPVALARDVWPDEPLPYETVEVVVGEETERLLEDVEVIKLTNSAKQLVDVAFKYDPDRRATRLVFSGKQDSGGRSVDVDVEDRDAKKRRFPVVVRTEPAKTPPLPVANPDIWDYRGRVCITAELQQPGEARRPGMGPGAMPGEYGPLYEEESRYYRAPSPGAYPAAGGAPALPGAAGAATPVRQYIKATGFRVYRKPAGAPDSDYRRVTTDSTEPAITKTEFASWIAQNRELRVVIGASAAAAGATALEPMGAYRPPIPAGPVVEEKRYCRFADTTMDYGETYDYKVVAIGGEKHITESAPVVLSYAVPADIELYLLRVDARQARFQVVAHDFPQDVAWEGALRDMGPGQAVSGLTRATAYKRATSFLQPGQTFWERLRAEDRAIDTGYVLVDVLPEAPTYAPEMTLDIKWEDRTELINNQWVTRRVRVINVVYTAVEKKNPAVLYLDKKGRLGAEYRGLRRRFDPPPRVPASGVTPEPGMPGIEEAPDYYRYGPR